MSKKASKQRTKSTRAKSPAKKTKRSLRATRSKPLARRRQVSAVTKVAAAAAWSPTPEAQKVIDTCQDVFDNVAGAKRDCNKFVKAVCDKFNVNPFDDNDNADAITNDIRDSGWCSRNGWTQLAKDPQKAKDAADRGELVVAGATGADVHQAHGHVVIVVSSEKLWKGYPYASWGKLGGVGKTNAKMTVAFKLADLPKVSYMSKTV
jgi:hypothetical protein